MVLLVPSEVVNIVYIGRKGRIAKKMEEWLLA